MTNFNKKEYDRIYNKNHRKERNEYQRKLNKRNTVFMFQIPVSNYGLSYIKKM